MVLVKRVVRFRVRLYPNRDTPEKAHPKFGRRLGAIFRQSLPVQPVNATPPQFIVPMILARGTNFWAALHLNLNRAVVFEFVPANEFNFGKSGEYGVPLVLRRPLDITPFIRTKLPNVRFCKA